MPCHTLAKLLEGARAGGPTATGVMSWGPRFQMTEYFLCVSLYHSDIILLFLGPESRGNYWVLFHLCASVVSADLIPRGRDGNAKTMFAREKQEKIEIF